MTNNYLPFSAIKKQAFIALSRFTLEIVQAKSEKEIFSLLANKLPQILPADRCSVTLLTQDKKQLEIYALNGSEGALSVGKFLPLDNSFSGDSFLQNKTLWHSNYEKSLKIDAQQLYKQSIKSIMNAPIKYEQNVIGTVNIGNYSEGVYNSDLADLMSLVVKLVSSYLEKQHLLEQAELGIERYKSYSLELEELAAVAQKLSGAMNKEDVFSIIIESVSKIVSAQRISYVIFNEEEQYFEFQVILPHTIDNHSVRYPLGNTALGKVYESEEGHFFENFSSYNYVDIKILENIGLKSGWMSPIKINGKIVGLLNAASDSIVEDGHKKLSILNMLSGILGVTLSRVKLQGKIEYQAAYDELTDLPNRNQLNVFMEKAVARSEKAPFTILFIDLDRFKTVNDTSGHAVGDEILRQVTIRIQQQIRKGDFSARHGGDEFVVILSDCESVEISKAISQNIIDSIKLPFFVNEHTVHIGASIGLSCFPLDSLEPEELLKYSDIAMYLAKKNGRNNVQVYSSHLSESIKYNQQIDNLLRRAIEENELHLAYQPLFLDNKIIGVEALLRWTNKELGVVPPDVFIPIAEESLLISEITHWVLQQSICTIKKLRTIIPELYIAINISVKDCLQPEKLQHNILTLLNENNLPGSALEIELTENIFIDDLDRIETLFKNLKSEGIRFAIDDFGTGYSSLTYLLRLPFNTIKIDQSFIRRNDNVMLSIVKGIIDIAKGLSMHCIAEGVETEEQKLSLENLGCKRFQGYYFSYPLVFDELTVFLKRNIMELKSK